MAGIKYRKAVRDAVLAALAHPTTGYNAKRSALAGDYASSPATIDFRRGTKQFFMGALDPSEVELGPLLAFPAMALSTAGAEDTGRARGFKFVGTVQIDLVGIVTLREGAEDFDAESVIDAMEDATVDALNSYTYPVNVTWARETQIERSKLMFLEDGWRQWFTLRGSFLVSVA